MNNIQKFMEYSVKIKSTHRHDAGAYGRCSFCLIYSLDPQIRGRNHRKPCSGCGEEYGYTGSFKKPTVKSKWSSYSPKEIK